MLFLRHLFRSVAAIGISSVLDACNVTLGASGRVEPLTGNLMTTAQLKPKPCDGNTIRLLPQWPPGWDADFKLLAPANTVVTGTVKGGRLARLDITPSSRRKDVLVHSSRHAAMIITRRSHPRCLPIARA